MAYGEQLKGWRLIYGYKTRHPEDFEYSPEDDEPLSPPSITDRGDACCKQESCGCGCSVSVVDFDRLDQQ